MTAASHYSVQGPDRGREIHETAPVGQQDKRFPNRTPPGGRRRRRRREKAKPPAPAPADAAEDDPPAGDAEPPAPANNGEDHVVDTLA